MSISIKKPSDCNSKEEIRSEIDLIDNEIIKLFGIRFQFVKEITKYKENNIESIIARDRYNKVLAERKIWAEQNGLDGYIIESIYKQLIDYFINKELEIKNIETK